MEKNRNLIIGGLIVLLVICSIWGSVNSRAAKTLKLELAAVTAQMEEQKGSEVHKAEPAPAPAPVVVDEGRVHELEKQIATMEERAKKFEPIVEQLKKARAELVTTRKASKRMEIQLTQQEALIKKQQEALQEKEQQGSAAGEEVAALQGALDEAQKGLTEATIAIQELEAANAGHLESVDKMKGEVAAAGEALAACQEKEAEEVQEEDEMAAKVVVELETALAQIVGLEKIIEEKNASFEETSRELDRIKINMDVLLGKIAEQQDVLQELEQENADLVKDLTDKNKQLADLQDQLLQVPMQD